MRVFLSYRRTDVGGHAGRLADGLSQRLGARGVFQDVGTVQPGQDFAAAIDQALDACDALLAVIGPGWLTAADSQGARRLDQPRDYVRMELARALERGVRVVPVVVGGAGLPAQAELPDDLQALALRQSVVLRDEAWHQDLDGLLRALRGEPAWPAHRWRRWLATAAVAVTGATAVLWHPWRDEGGGAVPACASTAAPGWTAVTLGPAPRGLVDTGDGALRFRVRSGSWRTLGTGSWQVLLGVEMTNATPTSWYHADYRYAYLAASRRESRVACFSSEPDLVAPGLVSDATVGFEVECPPTGYLQLAVTSDEDRRGTLDVTAPTTTADC